MPTLLVVIASTRPGRVAPVIGRWFTQRAAEHGGFDVKVADLAELALPMMDEPHHPRLRKYTHSHTKSWSHLVDEADAFVFVMPEYNHTFTAPLKNALDYLYGEWAYKPVGFVSYGGVSGGVRAVQSIKPVVAALNMYAVAPAVALPYIANSIVEGELDPDELTEGAAKGMLDELVRVSAALDTLRSAAS
jgi:NAD(P)H-dependent FMN reductase